MPTHIVTKPAMVRAPTTGSAVCSEGIPFTMAPSA
jgi:hypothetical protein